MNKENLLQDQILMSAIWLIDRTIFLSILVIGQTLISLGSWTKKTFNYLSHE